MSRAMIMIGAFLTAFCLSAFGSFVLGQGEIYRPGQVFTIGDALPGTCAAGDVFVLRTTSEKGLHFCDPTNTWTRAAWTTETGGGSGLPVGAIVLIASGSCPSGYAEVSGFAGRMLIGTTAGAGDVGGTGGNDTLTPAGSVAWPAGVPAFTGSAFTSVINHTHPVSDPGHTHVQDAHNHTQNAHQHGMAEGTTDGSGTFMDRSNAAAATTAVTDNATATNIAATATNQSATTGVTTSNPSGGVSSITPAGSVAWPAGVPAFTGSGGDNRSAFVRVIGCSKT